jgi:hypothetical protein
MIKKTLLIALGIFLVYNLCLGRRSFRDHFVVQSQWQENITKAQEYLLDDRPHPYVLVGSSLFGRLIEADLGPGFRNIAFSGGSLFTGLELVARKPADTKIVFIETNMILRDTDEAVLSNAFRPVLAPLRTYLPGLRERCQPLI